jgi:hypothetical protein
MQQRKVLTSWWPGNGGEGGSKGRRETGEEEQEGRKREIEIEIADDR